METSNHPIILIFDQPLQSASSQSSEPQIKLADFGIYKATAVDDFNDQNAETRGWLAPEIYQLQNGHLSTWLHLCLHIKWWEASFRRER